MTVTPTWGSVTFDVTLPTVFQIENLPEEHRPNIGVWVRSGNTRNWLPYIYDRGMLTIPSGIGDIAQLYLAFRPLDKDGDVDANILGHLSGLSSRIPMPFCGATAEMAPHNSVKRFIKGFGSVRRCALELFPNPNRGAIIHAIKCDNAMVSTTPITNISLMDLWDVGLIPRRPPTRGTPVNVDGERMLLTPPDFISDIDFAYDFLSEVTPMYDRHYFTRVPAVEGNEVCATVLPQQLQVHDRILSYDAATEDTDIAFLMPQLTPVNKLPDGAAVDGETIPVCSLYPQKPGHVTPVCLNSLPFMQTNVLKTFVFGPPAVDGDDTVVYGTWHNGSLYLRQPLFRTMAKSVRSDVQKVLEMGKS